MTKQIYYGLLLIGLMFVFGSAQAEQITVKVDRDKVELGDIITVIVQTDFQVANSNLDTSILKDQFEVLSRQQSNQIQIINGDFSSFTRWQLRLVAKQAGKLMIPPFTINGVSSKPYPIEVTEPHYAQGVKPYFMESKTDLSEAFVQQQIIYTLRFYHQGNLLNGNIRPPNFSGAQSETLKEQSVFGKTINGRPYTVYEWRYALFPQKSGDLSIPGPTFTGLLSLSGRQKGIQSKANDITIKVLPIPQNASPWLPAKKVSIEQKWLNDLDNLKIGDSLSREISIHIDGLKSSQLPKFTATQGNGFKVYIDKENNQQQLNSDGVSAIKTIKQAIVPTQGGVIEIPALSIRWWNTDSQHFQTTELPAQTIRVLQTATQKSSTANVKLPSNSHVTQNLDNGSNTSIWAYISLALSLLLFATVFMLYRVQKQLQQYKLSLLDSQQQNSNPQQITPKAPLNSLTEFYQQQLQTLRHQFHIESVQGITNQNLKDNLLLLEAHLYKGSDLPDGCIESIEQQMIAMQTASGGSKKPSSTGLSALYRPED